MLGVQTCVRSLISFLHVDRDQERQDEVGCRHVIAWLVSLDWDESCIIMDQNFWPTSSPHLLPPRVRPALLFKSVDATECQDEHLQCHSQS